MLTPEAQAAWERLWTAKCQRCFEQHKAKGMPFPWPLCHVCGGKGLRWPLLSRPCPECNGTGTLHLKAPCSGCGGRGHIAVEPTPTESGLMEVYFAEVPANKKARILFNLLGDGNYQCVLADGTETEGPTRLEALILVLAEALLEVKDG